MTRVSEQLYAEIIAAQEQAQRAHNLAYEQGAPFWLCIALGRAQSILMTWQARLAGWENVGYARYRVKPKGALARAASRFRSAAR